MSDLISKQVVLKEIERLMGVYFDRKVVLSKVWDAVDALPYAQETHEERTETHSCDYIDRQDAIDALGEEPLLWEAEDDYTLGQLTEWRRYKKALEALPSAQQKTLKYSGDSICLYCMTGDCVGCIYEPMEGVVNG